MMRRGFVLSLLFSLAAAGEVAVRIENLGSSALGLFWCGAAISNMTARDYFYEKWRGTIESGSVIVHNTHTQHSFIVRSADFKTRVRVFIDDGDNIYEHPYRLLFTNLSADDESDDGPQLELKQSTSGYRWIEGTHSVASFTDTNHVRTL